MKINEFESLKSELLKDKEFIKQLARELATVHNVWGTEERLHLSQHVSLVNTLFNTLSGDIYIGDYTFTGHNVSILTGTHDIAAIGEQRMHFPSEGNDIIIGSGVWICSNSVILGPCKIGDNAVIGAGSVVLPNSEIGEDEFWAGVPAIKKKQLNQFEFVDEILTLYGLYEAERDVDGKYIKQWMSSERAKIYYKGNCEPIGKLNFMITNIIPHLNLSIIVNNCKLLGTQVDLGENCYSIDISSIESKDDIYRIVFHVDRLESPFDLGINNDTRKLGIAIQKIWCDS